MLSQRKHCNGCTRTDAIDTSTSLLCELRHDSYKGSRFLLRRSMIVPGINGCSHGFDSTFEANDFVVEHAEFEHIFALL